MCHQLRQRYTAVVFTSSIVSESENPFQHPSDNPGVDMVVDGGVLAQAEVCRHCVYQLKHLSSLRSAPAAIQTATLGPVSPWLVRPIYHQLRQRYVVIGLYQLKRLMVRKAFPEF